MPGIALLRWFGGQRPPPPSHKQGQGRGGRRGPRVAAPPHVGVGDGAAGALSPQPEDGPPAEEPAQPAAAGEPATAVAAHVRPISRLHQIVRAVAVPSAQLASRLLARPWEPLQEALQQQLAGVQAVKDACAALQVDSLEGLQDLLSAMILSESVYKVLDLEDHLAVRAINALKAYFPPQLVTLQRVQWALPHAQQNFLMAEGEKALFVAFMGTKRPRDMVTNVNLFQDQILFDAAASLDGSEAAAGGGGGEAPAAHRGFSSRAKAIPIEALYHQAQAQGKRLVLCGHSLGGAVAQLCAIRLLQQLPPSAHNTIRCIGFATPPIGNQALADMVKQNGWDHQLRNYLLPEDPIPGLLASRQPAVTSTAAAAAAAGLEAPAAQLATSGSAGEPAATAPLASVSVHSDALEARTGPRLPYIGRAFWVRREGSPGGASTPTRLRAAATGELGGGSSTDAAGSAVLVRSGAGQSAVAAAAAAATPSSGAPGLANNIAAAPQLGILRLSRLSKHVSPPQPAAARGSSGNGGVTAQAQAPLAAGQGARAEGAGAAAAGELAAGEAERVAEESITALGGASPSSSAVLESMDEAEEEGPEPGQPQLRRRRRRWIVPRPPLEAVAQSAQAAARLVTFPLSAAASQAKRVGPQYHELGTTLFVSHNGVSSTRPEPAQQQQQPEGRRDGRGGERAGPGAAALPRSKSAGALPAAAGQAQPSQGSAAPTLPPPRFWRAASAPVLQHAAVESGADGTETEEEAAAAADDPLAPRTLPPRTLWPHHRMLSYRNRILGIVHDSLQGRVWLPALPHLFPALPHPDDVALSELLAPGMFPLKAEAAVPASALAATRPEEPPVARNSSKRAASGGAPHDGGSAAGSDAQRHRAVPRRLRHPVQWGLLRLFRRPGAGQEGPPVELEVRVEGKGLHTVTRAWVETSGAAPSTSSSGGGSSSKERGGGEGTGVATARIVWQPASPLPASLHRRPVTVITPVTSFFSWLAVTLGWVQLLRRLQPAGKSDYLIARVTIPASVVRQASNPLQVAVNDAHLPGVRVGPKLTMHLQSDFVRASVPLDIRAAADMDAQLAGMGWRHLLPRGWWE